MKTVRAEALLRHFFAYIYDFSIRISLIVAVTGLAVFFLQI